MKDGSTTEEENSSQLPKEFSINNYPNPFNPETTIEYTVPESSPINIRIFNSNGQLVANLVNKHHSAGVYQVKWSGSNIAGQLTASGLYFMVMELPGKVINRKLLLLR